MAVEWKRQRPPAAAKFYHTRAAVVKMENCTNFRVKNIPKFVQFFCKKLLTEQTNHDKIISERGKENPPNPRGI